MLGKNLRSMCCISRLSSCTDCLYSKNCVYSYIFETVLTQDNQTLPGRDKGSHPFSLSVDLYTKKNPITDYSFNITLFGKAIEYLPYIYAAFVRSGQNGIFKSRSKFEIVKVVANNVNILIDQDHLNTKVESHLCIIDDTAAKEYSGEVLIELKSPLRFKIHGKYTTDFTAQDFFNCLYRRAKTICSLYGEINEVEMTCKYTAPKCLYITDKKLKWIDFNHYSSRQKNAIELGGVIGNFKIKGTFSNFERNLLRINKISGTGKNTNFGLGQIDYWEKWEE